MILDHRRPLTVLSRDLYSLVQAVTQLKRFLPPHFLYIMLVTLYRLIDGFPEALHSTTANRLVLGRLIRVGLPYRKKEVIEYFG